MKWTEDSAVKALKRNKIKVTRDDAVGLREIEFKTPPGIKLLGAMDFLKTCYCYSIVRTA